MGFPLDGYKRSVETLENLLLGSSSHRETRERIATEQSEEARVLWDYVEGHIEGYWTFGKNTEAGPYF